MRKWLHDFFSTSNEINENTVMGVLSFGLLVAAYFTLAPAEIIIILASLTGAFFGLGSLKR